MRVLSKISVLGLAALVGCSTMTEKPHHVAFQTDPARNLASVNELVSSKAMLAEKIDSLMTGIFQSYMLGQVYLQDFDQILEKGKTDPLKSDAYASLLSVRTIVDELEHDVNNLYVNLVLVSSLPEYSPEQKLNAELGLKAMGKYMDGMRTDKTSIPENLKPMVLSNLREKQTDLYEQLKAYHDSHPDKNVKEIVHKNMVLLRATRMSFFKQLKTYKVDKAVFAKALKEEKQKKSFKEFEADVKNISKDIKLYLSEVGRDISSESTWVNLTGNTFPVNTWSITYDDGPGRTTTLEVLKNLKDREMVASFFVLAKQVEAYTSVAKQVKDAGMDMCSHSYTHAQITKVGPVQMEREIGTSKKVIEEKLDTKIRLFRLPYGAGTGTTSIRSKIMEHGMKHVFWNVDTLDWQDKNPQSIMNRTLGFMKTLKKGIVLFHDIHPQSVIASTMLMDHFKKTGANVCTVQGVLDQMEQNLPSCK